MVTGTLAKPSLVTRPSIWAPSGQIAVVGFLAIVGQRFGVPVGDAVVPISTIALLAMYVRLLAGGWPLPGIGVVLWCGLVTVGSASAIINPGSHPMSLFMMLATYVPLLLMPSRADETTGAGQDFFRGVIAATKIGTVLALVQVGLQWLGQTVLWDPVADYVPKAFQVSGFNSAYSLQFVEQNLGLSYKPNGVIFLEPSFLSLYAALGILWIGQRYLVDGDRGQGLRLLRWLVVFGTAIGVSISTTGLLIMAFGAIALARRFLADPRLVVMAVAAAGAGIASGFLGAILAKATEGFRTGTSSGLRLTVPYELLSPYVNERPILGHGPGVAGDLAASFDISGLQTPTVLKALLDYGLVGATFFLVAACVMVAAARPPATLTLALLAAWLIPTEALLNSTVVALLFFALAHWREGGPGSVDHVQGGVGSERSVRALR